MRPESTDADIPTMVGRLGEIPRHPNDFTVSEADATSQFGSDAALLTALREAGLSSSDGRSFARWDLHYVGLRRGLARQYLWVMSLWRRALDRFLSQDQTQVRITYLPQLGRPETVRGRIILSEDGSEEVDLRDNQAAGEIVRTMRATWPIVPDPVAALLGDVASLDFCLLPPRLRGDLTLARRLRFADCFTAARLTVEDCLQTGYDARIAHGLIVAVPFSSSHTWAEVLLDGAWTPVDPLMISVMQRFGDLDPRTWPTQRSFGPLLARIVVTPRDTALVSVDGEYLTTTYLTQIE